MPSKKKNISLSISRKKRCKNGTRRDKNSGECIPFTPFTTFNELQDQEISEKGITVSIESLDNSAITKIYNNKVIVGQKLISENDLEKVAKKSTSDFKRILKIMKKCKKNPDIIKKDSKFQQFLKKQKALEKNGGGGVRKKENEENTDESIPKTKLIVQKKVIDIMSPIRVKKLRDRIELIERAIRITGNVQNDWWSYLTMFNLLEIIGISIETLASNTILPSTTTTTTGPSFGMGVSGTGSSSGNIGNIINNNSGNFDYGNGNISNILPNNGHISLATSINGQINNAHGAAVNHIGQAAANAQGIGNAGIHGNLGTTTSVTSVTTGFVLPTILIDFGGALFLMILDILNSYFPNSTLANITQFGQYIYWAWVLGSTFFVLMPVNIIWAFGSIITGLTSITYTAFKPMPIQKLKQLEDELAKTKLELADELQKEHSK